MSDPRELAQGILRDTFIMILATSDAEGPWSSPVIYTFDDDMSLYWLSKRETRHSQAIERNGTVGIAIVASWSKNNERALQISADAHAVEGELFEQENALRIKIGDMPPAIAGEATRGHSWYVAVPNRIELVHHEFGWERQRVL